MITEFSGLKRILIIRLSSFGDILLTTPLIRSIKKKNPSLQIDFILKEEFVELLQNNPYITNVYKYSVSKFEKEALFDSLTSTNFDLAIDLQNNLRSKEIIKLLKCNTLKFRKHNINKFLLVHFKINKLKNAAQIPLRYAAAAGGFELDGEGLDFFTNKLPDTSFDPNEKYIGLCPGAKHFTKRWPVDYFIDLGKRLETSGYKVVIFGGPEEAEICFRIQQKINDSLNLYDTSILQVSANMKMCKAIYTNDSGLMHLASAVKVPVIAFFGSTVREFGFFPYKGKSIILEKKDLSCRPCTHIGRKSCPKIHFKCMMEIKPALAFSQLTNILTLQ